MSDPRTYPDRPFLAVSAVIVRDGTVLIIQRGRPPGAGYFTVPGGVVEAGETLTAAVKREVLEETALVIEPVALAGYREYIARDAAGRVERHFVILPFAARWVSGVFTPNEEIVAGQWRHPSELAGLKTTDGLAEIVAAALDRLGG